MTIMKTIDDKDGEDDDMVDVMMMMTSNEW